MRNAPPLGLHPRAPARTRWRVAFCAAAMNAVQTGAFFMCPTTLMPEIVSSFRLPLSLSTVPIAMGKVVYVLLLIPGGIVVDRVGPRRCVLAGIFGIAVLLTLYAALVRTFAGLLAVHVSLAAAASVSGVPVYSIFVAQWFSDGIGLAMGLVLAGYSAAGTLVPAVLGPLETMYGWRVAMGAMAAVLWGVGLPVAYAFLHENHENRELPAMSVSIDPVASPQHSPSQHSPPDELTPLVASPNEALATEAVEVNKSWTFVGFALSYILLQYCFGCFGENIMFYLHTDCRIPLATAALYFSALNFASFSAKLIGGHLGDRFDRFHVAAAASGLAGVGICVLFITPLSLDAHYLPHLTSSQVTIAVFVIIFGFGYGCIFNCLYALVPIVFGRKNLGTTQSSLFGLGLAGNAVGSVLTGVLRERYGSYQRPFLIAAVACIANFITFNITRITLRDSVPTPKEAAATNAPPGRPFEHPSELDLIRARDLAVMQRIGAMSDDGTPRASPSGSSFFGAMFAASPQTEQFFAGASPPVSSGVLADMARPLSQSQLREAIAADVAVSQDGLQVCEGFPIARDWSSPRLGPRNGEGSGTSGYLPLAGPSSPPGTPELHRSSTAENIIRSGVISASLEAPGYLGHSIDRHRSFSSFGKRPGRSANRVARESLPP